MIQVDAGAEEWRDVRTRLMLKARYEDMPLDTEKPLWHKAVDNLKHFASAQASLEDELSEARRELSHVRSDYLQLGVRCSALASERDALRQRLAQAQEYLETLQDRFDAGGVERDQANQVLHTRLAELQAERDQARQQCAELETQLMDGRRTIEALQERIAGDQARETELSAELQKRLDDIGSAHAELNTAYLERDQLARALEDELALARSELTQLQDGKRNFEMRLAERDLRIKELQQRVADLQIECEMARPRVQELETALAEAGGAVKNGQAQLRELEWRLGEKTKGYETVRANLVDAETERKRLLSTEAELNESLRKAHKQLQMASQAVEAESLARRHERRVLGVLLAITFAALAIVLLSGTGA